ncbi:MAG: AraC family transcriptional regulator [Cellulosilyticaceae bacterium]
MATEKISKRIVIDYRAIHPHFTFQLGKVTHMRANGLIEEHTHPKALEITYFIKGDQVYTVEGRDYPIGSGELFVTFPGEVHGSGKHPKDKSQIYYMIIELDGLKQLCFDADEADYIKEQFEDLKERVFKGKAILGELLEQLLQYGIDDTPVAKTQIRNLVVTYILEVLECTSEQEDQQQDAMIEVTNYIEKHIEESLTIRNLANAMNLSEGRFKANFRKAIGIPPQEYILRQKIKEAKYRLKTTNQTATDIALDLGFSSSQYFATVFKRFTAVTPMEYRKLQDKEAN